MLFNSTQFLLFFPLVTLIYFIIPKKVRYLWLLVASYYFYMCWNPHYVVLLLFSTTVTYLSGIFLEKVPKRLSGKKVITYKKAIAAISFASNLGVLFYFKYINFASSILIRAASKLNIVLNIPTFDVVLPVGISFFTFQALSYTIDVYRGEIYSEKNFFRYALYVSFFPQLVAGPIERSKNLLKQLAVPTNFNFLKARDGFLLMLWGYFLKVVLADRIAIFVDAVYNNYTSYTGWYCIVATVLFAFQIYCDFAGYSTIAIGASEIMGITLMENFNAPYTAMSVSDFWRRWHISLTSWFRDYLYIPLGGNRKGKFRKNMNRLIVFLASGLWHGASMHFIIWGGINGLYQIIGEITLPIRNKLVSILRLDKESIGFRIYKSVMTFIFVDIAWVYFRADSFLSANKIIASMAHADNPWVLFDGSIYKLGLNEKNFRLMIICIGVLMIVDYFKNKGISIRNILVKQDYLF